MDNNCNPCNTKLKTYNCDPNNKDLWFKESIKNIDPVLANIYYGGWLCNY